MRRHARTTPTVRAARWSAAHPAKAIVGWIVVAVCVAAGAVIGTNQAGGSDFWVGEAGRAEQIATEGGVPQPVTERVLVTPGGGGLAGAPADAAAADVAQRLRGLPVVADVSGPQRAADGTAVVSFLFVSLLELKQIGLAVAVILDAVVIRILILPAALTLLGDRSWWPARPLGQARSWSGRTPSAGASRNEAQALYSP